MKARMDYKLYYWEAPFRGNFIEFVLADIGSEYSRHDASEIYPEKSLELSYPGMAPPYLYEVDTEKYYSQMPATVMYLARRNGLLHKVEGEYLSLKIICDCHDILTEITNFYGQKMWTNKSWDEFKEDRLSTWLELLELYAKMDLPRLAQLMLSALVGPIIFSFPKLEPFIETKAPHVLKITRKIENQGPIAKLLKDQRGAWGDIYCGGEIEKSLNKVI